MDERATPSSSPVAAPPAACAPLRVALVLATSTGGVGRHVAGIARGLRAVGGYRVLVVGPVATDRAFGFSAAGAGVRFRAAEVGTSRRPLKAFRAVLHVRRLSMDADVVHAHGLRAAVVSALALAGRSRPALVVTMHNAMLGQGFRRGAGEFVMCRVAARADAALVVSPDLADAVRRARPDVARALVAARLSAPGHDAMATRMALGVPPDCPLVLAIGRLHRQKGFDVLVAAAGLMRDAGQRAVTVVAGEGPERGALASAISRSGVDVRLLGNRRDVADLVRAADVVVMPSRWEGWPLAAAEVLGAGTPLVATRVGGLPELVGDSALLVAPEEPDALADAVVRVLRDRRLARELAAKGRQRAAALPTAAAVVAQLDACYRRVAGRAR